MAGANPPCLFCFGRDEGGEVFLGGLEGFAQRGGGRGFKSGDEIEGVEDFQWLRSAESGDEISFEGGALFQDGDDALALRAHEVGAPIFERGVGGEGDGRRRIAAEDLREDEAVDVGAGEDDAGAEDGRGGVAPMSGEKSGKRDAEGGDGGQEQSSVGEFPVAVLAGEQTEEGGRGGEEIGEREPAGLASDGDGEQKIADNDERQLGHGEHGAHGAEVRIVSGHTKEGDHSS